MLPENHPLDEVNAYKAVVGEPTETLLPLFVRPIVVRAAALAADHVQRANN